jgi:integrase
MMGNGTITKRINKRTKAEVHQATVRLKGHKSVSRTFDTHNEAEQFLASIAPKLVAYVQASQHSALTKNPVLTQENFNAEKLADVLNLYEASPKCAVTDKARMMGVRKHIESVTIGEIDFLWVEGYIKKLISTPTNRNGTYTYSTVSSHMGLIARACRWRARQLKLPRFNMPFSTREDFPRDWDQKRDRRLSAEEEQKLRDHFATSEHASSEHWLLLLDLVLETGARLQEMVRAEVSEFDVEARVWNMPALHTKKKAKRAVSLTPKAVQTVKRLLLLSHPLEPRIFHTIPNTASASTRFHTAVRKCGIKGLRLHDLRHEAISRLVSDQRDVRIIEIMAMVGHKSAEMLHRYNHGRADEIAKRMK